MKDKGAWVVPESLDCEGVRGLLADFEAMREKIRKPINSRPNLSKVFRHFDDQEHLIYALETCIANEYQGLKADYRPRRDGNATLRSKVKDPRGNLALLDAVESKGGSDVHEI